MQIIPRLENAVLPPFPKKYDPLLIPNYRCVPEHLKANVPVLSRLASMHAMQKSTLCPILAYKPLSALHASNYQPLGCIAAVHRSLISILPCLPVLSRLASMHAMQKSTLWPILAYKPLSALHASNYQLGCIAAVHRSLISILPCLDKHHLITVLLHGGSKELQWSRSTRKGLKEYSLYWTWCTCKASLKTAPAREQSFPLKRNKYAQFCVHWSSPKDHYVTPTHRLTEFHPEFSRKADSVYLEHSS